MKYLITYNPDNGDVVVQSTIDPDKVDVGIVSLDDNRHAVVVDAFNTKHAEVVGLGIIRAYIKNAHVVRKSSVCTDGNSQPLIPLGATRIETPIIKPLTKAKKRSKKA